MSATLEGEKTLPGISPAKAWLRALELTAPIPQNPHRVLPTVIEGMAARMGDAPALVSDRDSFSYAKLQERANQYARWAVDQGLQKGDVVCLLMPNRPEYFAAWLGITSIGGVVSLLNTNLAGSSLAHCVQVVAPKQIIVADALVDAVVEILPQLGGLVAVWAHGGDAAPFPRIDLVLDLLSGAALSRTEEQTPSIEDLALYIYTSGTTGMPKAARVSHARAMQWAHWFAGMMDVTAGDRMYNCLPMYHSVGGVQAIGAMLVAGASVVVREKFSASQFWDDVVRWDCTVFQYIGELCRYLLHTPVSAVEREHRIRLACGNGLAGEVWEPFKSRFNIAQILEFYAATEGSVSLFNVQGKPGAIGHIPSYLTHRFSPALIAIDLETGEPTRDEHGLCMRAKTGEAGEALGKIADAQSGIGTRFDGYTSADASEKKVLRDVLAQGDAWFRTGDLLRKDGSGYYYFVDRIGDTFRRKGENVATSEVAGILCEFPGVRHANVYGVYVPDVEGRVGMAALAVEGEIDLVQLHMHIAVRLPHYARPVFLRLRSEAELTGTFKYSKAALVREGYDPSLCSEPLYFDGPGTNGMIELDSSLYQRIQSGEFRL